MLTLEEMEKMPQDVEENPKPCDADFGLTAELEVDSYVVSFDGPNDPINPINWSRRYKWCVIGLISFMNLVV